MKSFANPFFQGFHSKKKASWEISPQLSPRLIHTGVVFTILSAAQATPSYNKSISVVFVAKTQNMHVWPKLSFTP